MFGDGCERLAEENLVTIQMLWAAILLRPGRYFAHRWCAVWYSISHHRYRWRSRGEGEQGPVPAADRGG